MYRSMIIGEGEKIKSIPFKHILIFVDLVVCVRSSAPFARGKSSAPFVRGKSSAFFVRIKELVKDSIFFCKNCGRTAHNADNLCNSSKF